MPELAVIGKYFPGQSVVHRMDPRAKLLASFALFVIVLMSSNFLSLAICALFIVTFFALAHIPFKHALKSIAPLLFIVIITIILNIFVVQGGTVYFHWWIFQVSSYGIYRAIFLACRIILLLFGMSLLTLTSTTLDITDAFDYLLRPFAKIGVPSHELSMMLGLAIRFLPQFITEFQTIYRAQISRGAELSLNPFKGGIKTLSSLMIPLFTSAFRHAETLSGAMEARCYHGNMGRTRLKPLKYNHLDRNAAFIFVAMFACVLACNIVW